jgi:hypothetical protein
MQILAILTPKTTANLADFDPLRLPEEKKVWAHYTAGHIRQVNFQPEPIRVLLTFEAPDNKTVEGWLSEFPMVARSLFDIDLIAAGPWLPLEALFAEGGVRAGNGFFSTLRSQDKGFDRS